MAREDVDWRWAKGRSFDERRGAIPKRQASRPTITAPCGWSSLLRQGYGGRDFGQNLALGGARIKHAILPNEPTVFERYSLRIRVTISSLQRKVTEKFGGFVFQNEPTGGGF